MDIFTVTIIVVTASVIAGLIYWAIDKAYHLGYNKGLDDVTEMAQRQLAECYQMGYLDAIKKMGEE